MAHHTSLSQTGISAQVYQSRRCWVRWLYLTKRRYGLRVPNYIVTFNHIHLLVMGGEENVTPESLR